MTRFAHIVIFFVVLLLLGVPGLAIERFPPPDFEEGYKLPVTQVPGPRANLYEYLDVAVLVVALSLA
ncbi:MAG: hypothetical protein QF662_07925, partial [Phycisphaerae bacterium]|nr:hypothetical protein [Phycisphaerae bacterium]